MSTTERICLVHLVRETNGIEPFARFVRSYREHEVGAEHDLVLLYKGFAGSEAVSAHRELMDGLRFEERFISDHGFDVDAYQRVGTQLARSRYCFVNSYSQVLADGWLAGLDNALRAPDVGLAGASGSWASIFSYVFYELRLPSAYSEVFPDYRQTRERMRRVSEQADPSLAQRSRGPAWAVKGAWSVVERTVGFERYPAQHVRTNAFAVRREVLARLRVPGVRRKAQAYRLESGRASLTNQVQRMGLRTVVTGRDGVIYEPAEWPQSETLWQGTQANLLVSDNQTDKYAHGDAATRELLSRYAWGRQACPSLA